MVKKVFYITLFIGLFVSSFGCARGEQNISLEALNKDIQKELPNGSTASQVKAFLDARNIDHGDLYIAERDSDYPSEINMRLIRASIRHYKKDLLGWRGIFMSFRFDDKDTLIDYKVNVASTYD
jgi:hypothetical protein